MSRMAIILVLVSTAGISLNAQLVVHDPAVTVRNSITAALEESRLNVLRQEHSQLRRMAQRLSMFTNLAKYVVVDAPLWRIHPWESADRLVSSRNYLAALSYGDAAGAAFEQVGHPVLDATDALARLTPQARRALTAQLASLDLASAAVIAATHDTGQLRYNGRRELLAIQSLEGDVTNGSLEQSTTAVLDKISGAALVGARQRQARIQLMRGVVEQLLVEGKRVRDTEANAMNMQLVAWRDRQAANTAFVTGSGDALRSWRQP